MLTIRTTASELTVKQSNRPYGNTSNSKYTRRLKDVIKNQTDPRGTLVKL